MPARNSVMNKEKNEFRPVKAACELYYEMRELCLNKMPKKYDRYESRIIFEESYQVMSKAIMANRVPFNINTFNEEEARRRLFLWEQSREHLHVLWTLMDGLSEVLKHHPINRTEKDEKGKNKTTGVSFEDIKKYAKMMEVLMSLLTNVINNERKKVHKKLEELNEENTEKD